MIRNTFQDYGLQFRLPDFSNLAGTGAAIGGYYGNKEKRAAFADLIRKKMFEQMYPDIKVAPGAPIAPPKFEYEQTLDVAPVDPYFNNMKSLYGGQEGSQADDFVLSGMNIGADAKYDPYAAGQYMDELSRFEDDGSFAKSQLAPLIQREEDIQRAIDTGLFDNVPQQGIDQIEGVRAAQAEYTQPYDSYGDEEAEYKAELAAYEKEKAIYDAAVKAGYVEGDDIREGLLSRLGDVDEDAALRELGYTNNRGATANFLMKQENRRKANDAQAIADEAWNIMNSSKEGSKEHTEAAMALNAAARDFQQFSGKEYKAPSEFKREKAIGQEKRETTKIKNDMSKSIKDYTKGYIDTRKNVTKNFNEAAKNAKAFKAAYKTVKGKENVPVSSYQAMLKAINKMLEPNSAVMQGEADAFLGSDIANTLRGQYNSVTSGFSSLLYNTGANNENDFKPTSVSQTDVKELINLYNALIDPLSAGKDSIEKGQGTYFTNIKDQLKAEYGDTIGDDDMETLLDKKRFKSLLYGQMYIDKLPGKIGESNNINTDSDTADVPKPPPKPRQDWRVVSQGGRKYRVLYKNGKATSTYKEIK